MGNFQKGGRGGGFRGGSDGRSFQKKGWGNDKGGSRDTQTMHKAVCDECHKSCEVPFRPSGDKPIFCNDCFSSKRDGGNDRGGRKDFGAPRREYNDRPQTSTSFKSSGSSDETKQQLALISSKLDTLISTLSKFVSTKDEKETTKTQAPIVKKEELLKSMVTKAAVTKTTKKPAKKVAAKKIVAKKKK